MQPKSVTLSSIVLTLFGFGMVAFGAWIASHLTFLALFLAIGFVTVGLVASAIGVSGLRAKSSSATVPAPGDNELQGNETGAIAVSVASTLVVNSLTIPGAVTVWNGGVGTQMPALLHVGLPVLIGGVGIAVGALAWHRVSTFRRLGAARLTLDPMRQCLGRPATAELRFPFAREPLPRSWQVTFTCEQFRSDRASDGESAWVGKVLWRSQMQATTQGGVARLTLVPGEPRYGPHEALPSKERDDHGAVFWTLEFLATSGPRDYRSFDLTVFAGPDA